MAGIGTQTIIWTCNFTITIVIARSIMMTERWYDDDGTNKLIL